MAESVLATRRNAIFVVAVGAGIASACARSDLGTHDAATRPAPAVAMPAQAETVTRQQTVAGSPVSATVKLPESAAAGAPFAIELELGIDPLWEIGALAETPSPTATRFELKLPAGVESVGTWEAPAAGRSISPDGYRVYTGRVAFRQALRAKEDATPGKQEVRCTIQFQACNERQCLQPQAIELALPIEISDR